MTPYPLEPSRADMEDMGTAAVDFLADFVENLPKAPAANIDDPDRIVPELLRQPAEGPGEFNDLLEVFGRAADQAVESAGPGYLAYIPGGGFHKGMFLPYGTGVLLVRDAALLRAAHAGDAHYLQDLDADRQLPDYAALGPELTREFRGLRLRLPLHLYGVAAFRAALDEKLDLAAYAYRELAADPLLQTRHRPDLSVVVFRLPGGDRDNRRFLERIIATKRVFLSSTRVDDRYLLRLCVLGLRTHADRVAETVDIVRAAARGA